MDENQIVEIELPEIDANKRRVRWIAFLLLAVIVCGVLTTPLAVLYRTYRMNQASKTTIVPKAEGVVNRIAFITANHQLASIESDGSNERRLTDQNRRFTFPTWSPDGLRLAVIGEDSIFVVEDLPVENDNRKLELLYEDETQRPFYLYWSPDSRQLSFLANHSDGISLQLAETGNGPGSGRLLAVGQPFYWDWTPSGDHLLIHSGSSSGTDARLALIDPIGGNNIDLARPGFFQAPGISQSGNYLAYAERDPEGQSDLVVWDHVQNAEVARIDHMGLVALGWSPSEDLLAYTSPSVETASFYGPLHVVNPLTDENRTISPDTVIAFFWSPDGQTIAYLTLPERDSNSIQVKGILGKDGRQAKSERQQRDFQLDLWVVDAGSGFRRRLARFVPTTLFVRQFLPFFDQYALSHRLWSPESDALVLPMLDDGKSRLFIVPLSGAPPKLLADGEIGFWSHQ